MHRRRNSSVVRECVGVLINYALSHLGRKLVLIVSSGAVCSYKRVLEGEEDVRQPP